MAATIIRTTYALDAETVARLDRLARGWKLSRSAALRKLIREREPVPAAGPDPRLAALEAYQAAARKLTVEQRQQWIHDVRQERLARSRKLEKLWRGQTR